MRELSSGKYRRSDVARITGLSVSKIKFLVNSGLVTPEIPAPQQGSFATFSDKNLIEFGMIQVLQDEYGLDLNTIGSIFDLLREGKCSYFESVKGRKEGEFIDFFANDVFGTEVDLVYLEQTPQQPKYLLLTKVLKEDCPYGSSLKRGEYLPQFEDRLGQMMREGRVHMVALGVVKKKAMQNLGIFQ